MKHRILPLFVLAMVMVVAGSALADDKKADKNDKNTHTGKVVKVEGNKLTMVGDKDKKEHTHQLAPRAQIIIDGKQAKLTDLKKDMFIQVTTKEGDEKTAVRVLARSEKPKDDPKDK